MKKLMSVILVIVLLLTVLCSCKTDFIARLLGQFTGDEDAGSSKNKGNGTSNSDFSALNLQDIVGLIPTGSYPEISYVGFLIDTEATRRFNAGMEEYFEKNYKEALETGKTFDKVEIGARNLYKKYNYFADDSYLDALEQRTELNQFYTFCDSGSVSVTRDGNIITLCCYYYSSDYRGSYFSLDLSTGKEISLLSDFLKIYGIPVKLVQEKYRKVFEDAEFYEGYDPEYEFTGTEQCNLFTYGWDGLPVTRINVETSCGGIQIFSYHDSDKMFICLEIGL